MSASSLSGSCLCGAVRYTATGEAQRFYHCHCKRCRKATGTSHASNLFLSGTLNWDSGQEQLVGYQPPEAVRFTNTFCRICGSNMPRIIENSGAVFIPAGSLDEEPGLVPQARIFTGSRAAWSCDGTELPGYNEYPG